MDKIVVKEFPDIEFDSKVELFKALKNNKERIMKMKKASVKHSDSIRVPEFTKKDLTIKGIELPGFDKDSVYAVINTTNYLDSHSDVHLSGIWNKSVKEQQGNVLYIVNHDLSIGKEIAYEKDIEMMLKEFKFSDLGYSSDMTTQALIFKVKKDDIIMDLVKDRVDKKIPSQHSVRMQYVKLDLAIDSDDEDFKEEKRIWDKYKDSIANQDALEQGYFWAVSEAKIYLEGSMVVRGSNDITPMILGKSEPSTDTHKTEPSNNDTQKKGVEDKDSEWDALDILKQIKF